MTLDLSKIATHLGALVSETTARQSGSSLNALDSAYGAVDSGELASRILQAKTSWLLAEPTTIFQSTVPAPLPPGDYTVAATDGSFILPDRHSPARYIVVNIGQVTLRYGSEPWAEIKSEPSMFVCEDDLYVPAEVRRIPVNGSILGFKRAAAELQSVADVAARQHGPTIALQDGTLILWSLESQSESVINWVLGEYLSALDKLKRQGIPVASFISFPASKDVVNSVRVSACDYPLHSTPVNCDHCHWRELNEAHTPACAVIPDVDDRFVFEQVAHLQPGERSQVFSSESQILDRYGPDHAIQFFYFNTGTEVGRVELPRWTAEDQASLDLVHATVYQQCNLGRGYPSALQEAHEVAAIRPDERLAVELLVEKALAEQGLDYRRSGKVQSKRGRFI